MKPFKHFSHFAMLALLCVTGIMSLPQQAVAALKVTKPKVTISTYSSLGEKDTWVLFCEGYETLITTDSNGNTQVYAKPASEVGLLKSDTYLVELPAGVEWNRVIICGGKEFGTTNGTFKLTMEGGRVSDIILGGMTEATRIIGNAELWITRGTVNYIQAGVVAGNTPLNGKVTINIGGLNYTGVKSIDLGKDDDQKSRTNLFINNDCNFYAKAACLEIDDVEGCDGFMIFEADRQNCMVYGGANPKIPSKGTTKASATAYTVTCENVGCIDLDDVLTIGTYSKLNITSCGGWGTDQPLPARATIAEHQHVEYITKPATCTEEAEYVSTCDVCWTALDPSPELQASIPALGHNIVSDARIEPTCDSEGLTAGSHCDRCGYVQQAQAPIAATGHSWGSSMRLSTCAGTSYLRICGTCNMVSSFGLDNSHDWIAAVTVVPKKGQLLTEDQVKINNLAKFNRKATCTRDGLQMYYCRNCIMVKSEVVERYNHSQLTHHDEVAATCTEPGCEEYWSCNKCSLKFKSTDVDDVSKRFTNLAAASIAPTGHVYGEQESHVKNNDTHYSDATCTEPAKYYQSCANCGLISNHLFFNGRAATGHTYRIKSIDYRSPYDPENGILTIECLNPGCHKEWNEFQFSIQGSVGLNAQGSPTEGYWYKSKLVETIERPTCVEGRGIYEVSVNYLGQLMRQRYENFIRPCGYVHNFGNDGVCHEQHYQMKYKGSDQTVISKDGLGNIYYVEDKEGNLIADNTVYSCPGVAYIIEPKQVNFRRGIAGAYIDPEDFSLMGYTDYDVTYYNTQQSFLDALHLPENEFYAGTFFDYDLTASSPLISTENLVDLDVHGHDMNFSLADATAYTGCTDIMLKSLSYSRNFANTNWQALYVPFAIPVATLEAAGLQVARLNDTHMYDDDEDGVWERSTIEFLRLKSGTVKANTPYVVRALTTGLKHLDLTDVELNKAENAAIDCSTTEQTFTFRGTYNGVSGANMVAGNYYAFTGGSLKQAASASASLSPQRWYMEITNRDGSPVQYLAPQIRTMVDGIFIDDEPLETGIETATAADTENRVYTLDGRRITDLKPGFYVNNGHKVVIR